MQIIIGVASQMYSQQQVMLYTFVPIPNLKIKVAVLGLLIEKQPFSRLATTAFEYIRSMPSSGI